MLYRNVNLFEHDIRGPTEQRIPFPFFLDTIVPNCWVINYEFYSGLVSNDGTIPYVTDIVTVDSATNEIVISTAQGVFIDTGLFYYFDYLSNADNWA